MENLAVSEELETARIRRGCMPGRGFGKEHNMAKAQRNGKMWALKGLLKRINRGDAPKLLRKEASQLVKNIDPEDIAEAEQSLINDGYSVRIVHQLSATFVLMGLHKEKDDNSTSSQLDNHILQKVKVEHDLLRYFLADLNNLAAEILNIECLTDVSSEFRKLVHIVVHLAVIKEHIEREEDVIFPYLTKQGWNSLCRSAQTDHSKIRIDIDNLVDLITSFNKIELKDFKASLVTIVQRLSPMMLEHLSYEDDLLCPIALVIIDDPRVWERIKALCDEIGYCL